MYRPPVYTCDWERTFFWERNAFSWKIPQIKVGFCSAATFLSSGWFSKAGFLKSAMVKSWTESCDAGYLSPPQQTPQSPFDLLLFSFSQRFDLFCFRDLIRASSELDCACLSFHLPENQDKFSTSNHQNTCQHIAIIGDPISSYHISSFWQIVISGLR